MNKLFPFLALTFIGFICACSKQSVEPKQSVVIGTWKLKSQYISTYVNGVFQVGATGTASDKSNASIILDNDGNYTANAVFSKTGMISIGEPGSAGFAGSYSIKDSILNMKPFLIGSLWLDTVFVSSKAIYVSNKIVSEKAIIRDTTSSSLSFSTEIVIEQTADTKTRTITTRTNYEYAR